MLHMVVGSRGALMVPASVTGDPTLTDKGRKARFGAHYVRLICGGAGYAFNETEIDEDTLAVDAYIRFRRASARVQVKCTSQFKVDGPSATWRLKPLWVESWADSIEPVYFVLVKIAKDRLVDFEDPTTVLHATAFWKRVNGLSDASGINFGRSDRFTIDTVHGWADEIKAGYPRGPLMHREGT